MIGQVCAVVCTVYSVAYSGYFLTQLTRKLRFILGLASPGFCFTLVFILQK